MLALELLLEERLRNSEPKRSEVISEGSRPGRRSADIGVELGLFRKRLRLRRACPRPEPRFVLLDLGK